MPPTKKNPSFTFPAPGIYQVKLKATDTEGNEGTDQIEIKVGNDKPDVQIAFAGNQTFYFDRRTIDYTVTVNDQEDGNTSDGGIAQEEVYLSIDYLDQGL